MSSYLPCDEGVIRGAAEAPAATTGGAWVLVATILGSGMVFTDGTVVNVALPALQSALGATGSQVQWVVEAYALFLASLLLVGGSSGGYVRGDDGCLCWGRCCSPGLRVVRVCSGD